MKPYLLTATTLVTLLGAAPEASARPRRETCERSSEVWRYTRCGCPVYSERYVAWFDEYGDPVWRRRELPVVHRCEPEPPRCHEPEYREVRYIERRPPPPIVSGGITIEASW
jgi:hypothetical protein